MSLNIVWAAPDERYIYGLPPACRSHRFIALCTGFSTLS